MPNRYFWTPVLAVVAAFVVVWVMFAYTATPPVPAALAQSGGTSLAGEDNPTYQLLAPTRLVSETYYTISPNRRGGTGLDMSDSKGWAGADIFVSADLAEGAALDTSVELSADGIHWAPFTYETTGFNDDGAEAIKRLPPITRQFVPGGERVESDYFLLVLAGRYVRVKLDATGVVTPSVWVTYRELPQWP